MKAIPMKATWNGKVIAESDDTLVVEGNHYFPAESVNKDFLQPSTHRTTCPWKGIANYYSIAVDDQVGTRSDYPDRDPQPSQ